MIKNFTILGERCSGTNYLEELMLCNFDIEITWNYGWKHFFGFYEYKKLAEEDETLFIGIVRHPIYWINSFFREQHHIPNKPKSIHNFLFDEFYSVDDNNIIMKEDLNYITGMKYKNIFELRFMKNFYLINKMPENVKNYILISYENLRDNYQKILYVIQQKFGLKNKYPFYKNINYHKKEKKHNYIKKEIDIPVKYQLLCAANLNYYQELKLGYDLKL